MNCLISPPPSDIKLPKPYYDDGRGIVIYNGDCSQILPKLSKFDLIVTSPPYDNLRKYGGHVFNFKACGKEISQSICEGGIIVWVVADETKDGSESMSSFRQAILFHDEFGLNLHDTMIWRKTNAMPQSGKIRYHNAFEYMFIFSKGEPKTTNLIKDVKSKSEGIIIKNNFDRRNDDSRGPKKRINNWTHKEFGCRFNVWDIPVVREESIMTEHPAVFPARLVKDHINSWSNVGDKILDPFGGSGTTARAAKDLCRKCTMIEIEEKYCEIAAIHLQQEILI